MGGRRKPRLTAGGDRPDRLRRRGGGRRAASLMHLLATRSGAVDDGSEAVDLGQTPGEAVVLSAADTDLAILAAARARRPAGATSLRLSYVERESTRLNSIDQCATRMPSSD